MAITYNLAPYPIWQVIYPNSAIPTLVGLPLAGARIFTYRSTAHTTPKTTYTSNVGNPPPAQTNPVVCDSLGQTVIYWALDDTDGTDLYYVEILGPVGDDTVYYTFDNFDGAAVVPVTDLNTNIDINYVRNPQFSIWNHLPVDFVGGTVLDAKKFSTNGVELVCDDWLFAKNSNTATDTISQQTFASGQTDVPNNPTYFWRYDCTVAGSAETQKLLHQVYKDVQFLNGEFVSLSFWMRANSNARNITVSWFQNFGSGGSASAVHRQDIFTHQLDTSWKKYTIENVHIDSIVGKSIGTNRDDYCVLGFAFDLNAVSTYDICNVQFEAGSSVSEFQQNSNDGYQANLSSYFQNPTADLRFKARTLPSPPTTYSLYVDSDTAGWLPLNDLTIANSSVAGGAGTIRTFSAFNLYCILWRDFADAQCPVSTGRGASAVADWNADKTIKLPLTLSRLIGNSGHGATLTDRVPGVTGGGEDVLKSHTHAFPSAAHLPGSTVGWSGFEQFGNAGGASPSIICIDPGPTGGTAVDITVTASASANYTSDTMNPFTFLPFYIHL